jgi:hypothetical protein
LKAIRPEPPAASFLIIPQFSNAEKYKASSEISQYMNPELNRSRSFKVFYQGLLEIINSQQV